MYKVLQCHFKEIRADKELNFFPPMELRNLKRENPIEDAFKVWLNALLSLLFLKKLLFYSFENDNCS